MLDKLKQMMEMRKEAAQIQSVLEAERIETVSAHGKIKIIMNGKNEIVEISIHPDIYRDADRLPDLLRDAFNDSVRSAQKQMAKKMAHLVQ